MEKNDPKEPREKNLEEISLEKKALDDLDADHRFGEALDILDQTQAQASTQDDPPPPPE